MSGTEDDNGILFIHFPIVELAAALARSTMTVKRSLNELEDAGQILRVRQGFGEPNKIEALLNCAKEKRPLFHKPLEEMKVPVLFMGSKEDEMCRKNLEQEYKEMAAIIPSATIQIFEHGGHPAIASNAEQAAKRIYNFILTE